MRSFASDNYAGATPEVLEYIYRINNDFDSAYGNDKETAKAKELIRKEFGKKDAEVFFMFNGTGANTGVIRHALRPYEAVICAHTSHLNSDEAGAPIVLGAPLLQTDTSKVTVEDIDKLTFRQGDFHSVQARMVSIATLDEMGEVYSRDELRELSKVAKAKNLYLYVDGARIANALASLDISMKEYITDSGIDCINLGLTKVGAMMAESLVFLNKDLGKNFMHTQKNMAQIMSKMKYTSAQFIPMLKDGLYLKLAKHSNDMAQELMKELKKIEDIEIINRVDGNIIFAKSTRERYKKAKKEMPFYTMDKEETIARFVTSFETTQEDIDEFIKLLRS